MKYKAALRPRNILYGIRNVRHAAFISNNNRYVVSNQDSLRGCKLVYKMRQKVKKIRKMKSPEIICKWYCPEKYNIVYRKIRKRYKSISITNFSL